MNFSYWEQQSFLAETDVAVIGGGITGLQAALHLNRLEPSLKVLVLEKGILPEGASTKNAGFACFGSISEILADIETASENEIFTLVEKRWTGLQKLRETVGDSNLDFEQSGGYEVFDQDADFEKCAGKIDYFNQILHHITNENTIYSIKDEHIQDFGFKNVKHLIFNSGEGQLNAGKMIKALISKTMAAGINMLNGIKVLSLQPVEKGVILILAGGALLKVKKVIVATNGFAKELLPELDVVPARGQVLVTSKIDNLAVNGCFHYEQGYYYFRNIDGRILLGGGRNLDFKTEATSKSGLTNLVQDKLEEMLRKMIIPGKSHKIEYRWSGIMGFGKQNAPIIKKVKENIFCAVKMQGMGVAIGTLAGQEVAELVIKDL
jgi:hypothetical protein